MKIVGVGCGPGMLTVQAIAVLSMASVIYGSPRSIELVRDYIPEGCVIREIEDYRSLRTLPQDAIVLSTGDPMLAGLGYLNGEVIPGISSLQVALARLHIPMASVSVTIAHGRDHATAIRDTLAEVSRGRVVFLLADPDFDIPAFAASLIPAPPGLTITVCEHLGYPDERVVTGTPDAPPVPLHDLFVLVIDPGPGKRGH